MNRLENQCFCCACYWWHFHSNGNVKRGAAEVPKGHWDTELAIRESLLALDGQ
jgi:hypothetical protein